VIAAGGRLAAIAGFRVVLSTTAICSTEVADGGKPKDKGGRQLDAFVPDGGHDFDGHDGIDANIGYLCVICELGRVASGCRGDAVDDDLEFAGIWRLLFLFTAVVVP